MGHSVVKLHFLMVAYYVREMTVRKSCKCGHCGLFQQFALLIIFL